jgi:ABC-type lipoprotein release transport system permease subunit
MKMRPLTLMKRQANGRQRGMSIIGMLLLLVLIGVVALIAMQVIPMYIQYYSIKSTIESVRKESVGDMPKEEIQRAIQKRFDIGYVNNVQAKDLNIRNDRSGKVLDLVYQDERELIQGLYVVLKVKEVIPLSK